MRHTYHLTSCLRGKKINKQKEREERKVLSLTMLSGLQPEIGEKNKRVKYSPIESLNQQWMKTSHETKMEKILPNQIKTEEYFEGKKSCLLIFKRENMSGERCSLKYSIIFSFIISFIL